MISLEGKMKSYSLIVIVLIILFTIGFISTPLERQFLGLILGLIFSYISLWTTFRKARFVGEVAVAGLKNHMLLSYFLSIFGIAIRIALAIFCVWIALIYPESFHLISVITGYALIYIIIMADMLIQTVRKR
ncbi:ATP synthase subunit I [Alkalihalobacillus deserti]|uniref:ATP synthase subunit I n=1 Tax=Alkalihalobacillus deserti TaxID=2879466 RepID=UPI001D1434C5|nr:ATP synthase subunit I [Alkalihalobacillus deserti]